MKHLRTFAVLSLLSILSLPGSAHAGTVGDYFRAAGTKLGLGLAAIPYGLVDVFSTPIGMATLADADGRAWVAVCLGVPVGLMNGSFRMGVGARDVATFLFVQPGTARSFKWEPFVTGWDPMHPDLESAIVPRAAFRPSPRSGSDVRPAPIPARDF